MTLTLHSNADTLCTIMAFAVHTTPVMCLCMLRWCIILQHVSVVHTYCMKLMWAVICCFTLCGRAFFCNVSHFVLSVCMLLVWYMFLLYAQCTAVFCSCFFPHSWTARKPTLVSLTFPSTYSKSNLCNGHVDLICYIVCAFSLFYLCAGSYLYWNLQRYPQVPLKCSCFVRNKLVESSFHTLYDSDKKTFAISCLFRWGCFAIETETAVSACQHCECSQRYRDVKRWKAFPPQVWWVSAVWSVCLFIWDRHLWTAEKTPLTEDSSS